VKPLHPLVGPQVVWLYGHQTRYLRPLPEGGICVVLDRVALEDLWGMLHRLQNAAEKAETDHAKETGT
jgi:hypothetical protein